MAEITEATRQILQTIRDQLPDVDYQIRTVEELITIQRKLGHQVHDQMALLADLKARRATWEQLLTQMGV